MTSLTILETYPNACRWLRREGYSINYDPKRQKFLLCKGTILLSKTHGDLKELDSQTMNRFSELRPTDVFPNELNFEL
jgi:uncharacterized protein with PIN domain